MDFVNDTPFHVGSLPGWMDFPRPSRTVFVKGTFRLRPGEAAEPVPEPEQVRPTGDERWDGDPEASLRYESDFAHFKPRADLLLAGSCHAPGGRATPSCPVRFRVGRTERSLLVTGEREWRGTGLLGRATPPIPFTSLPLRYENAFGGSRVARNPVGKGIGSSGDDETGRRLRALPNVEDPGSRVDSSARRPDPAGFAPIPRDWPQRARLLGSYSRRWKRERWPWFPEDFDFAYYNAAPPELQVDGYLRGDEPVRLENLHPEHPVYESALPGLRVRCFVQERAPDSPSSGARIAGDGSFREVPLDLDTLWLDPEAEQLILVWRGVTDVRSEDCDEIDSVLVVQESLADSALPPDDYRDRLAAERSESEAEFAGAPPDAADQAELEAEGIGGMPGDETADAELAELRTRLDESRARLEAAGRHVQRLEAIAPNASVAEAARALLADAGVPAETLASLDRLDASFESRMRELGGDPDAFRAMVEPAAEASTRAESAPRIPIELAGADLTGVDLEDADLAGADLSDAILEDARLARARLAGANLSGANLSGADLREADLSDADLTGADLEGARLDDAVFTGASLADASARGAVCTRAAFDRATLTGSCLAAADLSDARLDGSRLERADLSGATLDRASLVGCNLTDAGLQGAHGAGVDLSEADLTSLRATEGCHLEDASFRQVVGPRARFRASTLERCDFTGAVLPDADFHGARLDDVSLDACDLTRARFTKSLHRNTRLRDANLFQATLERADLTGVDFSDANLFQAELWNARTDDAVFDGANLRRTKLGDA